MNDMTQLI